LDYYRAMGAEQIVGLIMALLVMLVGVVGCVIPGLPGTPLVLIAAIGHRLYFGVSGPSLWVLITLALLTAISLALDYVAGVLGAKKMGATWRGMVGAVVGGIVGLFFGLPGIIIGPFVGALLLELLGGYELKQAAKAGVGTLLGMLAGALGKFAICIVMITLFAVNVIFRSQV
jgi:uncharacterized protein YqgC (DUF456 family)